MADAFTRRLPAVSLELGQQRDDLGMDTDNTTRVDAIPGSGLRRRRRFFFVALRHGGQRGATRCRLVGARSKLSMNAMLATPGIHAEGSNTNNPRIASSPA